MVTRALIPDLLERSQLETKIWANTMVIAAGVLLLALAAQVEIPLAFSPVPLTGQTFAVLLVGASFGTARGSLSALLYLLFGAAGLPVFAGGAAGALRLVGPTGGYLVGFCVAALAMGWLSERGWDRKFKTAWPLMFLGHTMIFLLGVGWLSRFVGWKVAIQSGFIVFIPGEIVKTTLAAAVLPGTRRLLAPLLKP